MRIIVALVVGALAVAAGGVQVFGALAVRDRAEAGALVRLVPEVVARRVSARAVALPLPAVVKLVLARRAIDRGDDVGAAAMLAQLGPSDDRLALEGRLDEARGDAAGAMRAYLAAGDLAAIEARIATYTGGRVIEALPLQYALVARLQGDPTQRDTLANAYYDLGKLEEATAYRYWRPSKKRALHEGRAAFAFGRAAALSPRRQQYVIAYGNQLLNVGRYEDARAEFLHAHSIDATDSTPFAGLGEAALGEGDRAGARAALARAQRLDPTDPAVVRLAREIGT